MGYIRTKCGFWQENHKKKQKKNKTFLKVLNQAENTLISV